MVSNTILQKFLDHFEQCGEIKFYKTILFEAVKQVIVLKTDKECIATPHLDLINLYDAFLSKYRSDGKEQYLIVARIFRKVAHKIYRIMIKDNLINNHPKFLNVV